MLAITSQAFSRVFEECDDLVPIKCKMMTTIRTIVEMQEEVTPKQLFLRNPFRVGLSNASGNNPKILAYIKNGFAAV